VIIVVVGGLLLTFGISIKTTHLAFVSDGRPLRVPGAVRVDLTPSDEPHEARAIGLLLFVPIPLRVVLPGGGGGGATSFRIYRGAIGRGGQEVLFPCGDAEACCHVLTALKYACDGTGAQVGDK
jgi:hypothetical protein